MDSFSVWEFFTQRWATISSAKWSFWWPIQSHNGIELSCNCARDWRNLKIPNSTIDRHIQRLGLVEKLDIWIPHELKEIHLTKRINACDFHLKRNEIDPFLKQISLVMKNGLFRITSFEIDHGLSAINHHKQHWKMNCMKKILIIIISRHVCINVFSFYLDPKINSM